MILLSELIVLSAVGATGSVSSPGKLAKSSSSDLDAFEMTKTTNLIQDCGDTEDSARQRGCRFDYLTISWEHPSCFHDDIVDSFLSARDWAFYNDTRESGLVPPASWSQVSRGDRRYNVQWDFHFTHCIYVWKMMQAAVLERRPLADNLLALEHTRHCMNVAIDRRWEWNDLHTLVHVKWPKCMTWKEWGHAHYVE